MIQTFYKEVIYTAKNVFIAGMQRTMDVELWIKTTHTGRPYFSMEYTDGIYRRVIENSAVDPVCVLRIVNATTKGALTYFDVNRILARYSELAEEYIQNIKNRYYEQDYRNW